MNKKQVLQIFQDDQDIPGSFSLFYGQAQGNIEYYLEVEVLPSKIGDQVFKKALPIKLVQSLPSDYLTANNLTKYESVVQVSQFLCMSNGSTSIKCQFDKPYYYKGEFANLTLDIDNKNCNKKIQSIEFKIEQNVIIGKKDRIQNYDDDAKFQLKRELYKVTKNIEVKANKTENQIRVPLDLSNLDQFCCFGTFIECSYIMTMVVNYNGFLIFSQSELQIPIFYFQRGQFNQYYDNYKNIVDQYQIYPSQQQCYQQYQNNINNFDNGNQIYPVVHQNSGQSNNLQYIYPNDINYNNQQFVIDDAMQQQIQQQQSNEQQQLLIQQQQSGDNNFVYNQIPYQNQSPQNNQNIVYNQQQNSQNNQQNAYNYPVEESQQMVKV
ncbi:Immunoglobulin E-set [Pseudocohnilembus persalinus]|uniref:Immunoglobulin E-set n=1 Tax=Pseudocohnilembus persalinus TaxID=266149 RepID=A0A0V0QWC2_PSEPJ|nr:Immunoglobulin E-set [Pseudocohnilembus persalinus]|eukprot:KRX06502.1 Immunoglobulin E-set [Pseudocohnilembus persalinus]